MHGFWGRFSKNKSAVLGLFILCLVIFLAAIANWIYPDDPFRLAGKPMSIPGTNGFLLGSDTLGRDVASGIAHGAKTSMLIGLLATVAAVFIGIIFGALAGYYGGIIDDALMRITEIFQTIPSFVFAILLVAIMKPSIESIVIAITVVSWPAVARLVRGEFLSLKTREFVQACHTLGMSDSRIMIREILPNCLSPVIVIGSLMVATAILIESGLAFLGLGDPNIMSWGFQIGAGRTMLRSAWWVCTFPGIAILITVLAINLVGEGLNDAFNPRLRERN
ncbi:MAG: ABC transporter permease [SAR324 cluster bacterium]|jgi:peptide/nickel transport system permease protein|uniref:ABC transmembrane type-1 domain-containing protein n=1 Tax=marine metagenome TaxID=408172 RepID=A0A382G1H1_9ZZZZ|nr:ABC transporter permease [Deltaproteobacteria bacterium]MDP6091688.1 ABC transporter permease [SAR324 cluster bacterium]MBI13820.1 ABC transporter permease [Deltaproteobacteria bacterium]MBP44530.1 ABC transporter permease [Deltaproteobacteria bacterium]MDP6249211.1 ABC transporter permease [SAR324 cluster bacterium]|tara:strand:+ start:2790 stop:3623 length:834 start_codon:yes stop_codon:yes gene_type:complete